jgi:hypothetical protein
MWGGGCFGQAILHVIHLDFLSNPFCASMQLRFGKKVYSVMMMWWWSLIARGYMHAESKRGCMQQRFDRFRSRCSKAENASSAEITLLRYHMAWLTGFWIKIPAPLLHRFSIKEDPIHSVIIA